MSNKDDHRTFAEATRDVRPLKPGNRVTLDSERPRAEARLSRSADSDTIAESLTGPVPDLSGEDIAFRRPGIAERTFRKLRRGRFSIEEEIDLHGLTRSEARTALKDFLSECVERRLGCVRVIHGKGTRSGPDGPILKGLVHDWLAQWDDVLAFASAQAKHGGNGAVYVLLSKR